MQTKLIQTKDYLLLIDEEAEIKENDYLLLNNEHPKGRIRKCFHLTNNNALWNGKDWNTLKGKHFFIDPKESEGWGFVTELECKKIIAYYPLTKEAKELDLPLLPNPFIEEIEEIDENTYLKNIGHECFLQMKKLNPSGGIREFIRMAVEFGYKAAQSKQFSLEDMKKAIKMAREQSEPYYGGGGLVLSEPIYEDKHTEEEIIQSLFTQKLPKEFIPEYEIVYSSKELADKVFIYEEVFKTITNSEGKQELVGIYKY